MHCVSIIDRDGDEQKGRRHVPNAYQCRRRCQEYEISPRSEITDGLLLLPMPRYLSMRVPNAERVDNIIIDRCCRCCLCWSWGWSWRELRHGINDTTPLACMQTDRPSRSFTYDSHRVSLSVNAPQSRSDIKVKN